MEGEGGDEEGCVIPGARKEKGGRLTSGDEHVSRPYGCFYLFKNYYLPKVKMHQKLSAQN
jgi:hypothetical protein